MINDWGKIVSNFTKRKVMVLGDLMIDKYIFGQVKRISQEAPVQVIKVGKTEYRLGGAANVANNIASLSGKVILGGVIGKDKTGESLLENLKALDIDASGVIIDKLRPTIKKTRVIGINQQLLRLDYEKNVNISKQIEQEIFAWYKKCIKVVDIVVISDYAKGFLTENLTKNIIKIANNNRKKVIIDPKPQHKDYYQGAFLITPNEAEAKGMIEVGFKKENLKELGYSLVKQINSNVLITRGAKGMALFEKGGKTIINIATDAKEVFDVTGAGDTVTAVLALAVASNLALEPAVNLANKAAGIIVGKFGTAVLTPKELINGGKKSEEDKIKRRKNLQIIVNKLKQGGQKIVFTNGCFDILHAGHIDYLQKAKKLGDILIVGLNTDNSVRKLKGKNRPINTGQNRAKVLASLSCVDFVVLFTEDNPSKLISILRPDIHVKGGDYKIKDLPEAGIIKKYGGKIKIIPLVKGFSTTGILQKLVSQE